MPVINVGIGRIEATKKDTYIVPRRTDYGSKPAVIYCHGSSTEAWDLIGVHGVGQPTLFNRLADLGHVVVAGDFGGMFSWATDSSIAGITPAIALAVSLGATSPVHLIGASMGAELICRYAVQHPASVKSLTGIIPALDMDDFRINNIPVRAQIDTAWGVTYPAALPAGANPFSAAELAGIPCRLYVSDDDPVSPNMVSKAVAFAARVGGTVVHLGNVSHGDSSIGVVDPVDLHRHLEAA